MPNRPIAVPKKEVAVQIRSNDGHFVPVPPRSFQRPPIRSANEARYGHRAIAVPKRALRPQSGKCVVDWVWLLHDA